MSLSVVLGLGGAGSWALTPEPVLLVGNSYLAYNGGVAAHLRAMAAEHCGIRPEEVRIASETIYNARLIQHDLAAYLERHPDTTLVVVQGHSTSAQTDATRQRFREGIVAARAATLARGAQMALYLTPAYAPGHLLHDSSQLDRTARLYAELAEGEAVVPVGAAFAEAYRRRPDLVLHVPGDFSHPTPEGTYLAAAVVMASLWGVSPVGLTYAMDGQIAPDDAHFLQSVAADVALPAR